jgi:hypothetical protein
MTMDDLNNNDIATIEALIDILQDNEDAIEEDYNNREDLVALNKHLKDKLFHLIDSRDTSTDKKELVKLAIREYFELDQRDIVVVREQQIIIKLLDEQSIHEISEEEQGTIASRYNGINEDDLESFYNDIFLQEADEDFFYFVADSFVNDYQIAKKLDNQTYEQTVFPAIQSIISDYLVEQFDHNEEFFKGFSGYIFRIHFREVFEYIADILLTKLSESNEYVINFLKYYSLNVVIVNGKRYKVPVIESENGWKWNVASIMPVIKIYTRADMAIEKLEKEIEDFEKKTKEYYVSGMSPVAYNNKINKDIDRIRQEIVYSAKKLDGYVATLKDDPDNKRLKQDIHNIRAELTKLRQELNSLNNKLITKDKILKYTDIKRELDARVRQKEREEIVLEKNEESFISISDALVRALTSKKVLLS